MYFSINAINAISEWQVSVDVLYYDDSGESIFSSSILVKSTTKSKDVALAEITAAIMMNFKELSEKSSSILRDVAQSIVSKTFISDASTKVVEIEGIPEKSVKDEQPSPAIQQDLMGA